jgi:putative Ca2+/H+ antiporter (TMEM165/GDT1 family)
MDWKVFFATFGAVFVAELADKTQLVGINMSSKSGKPIVVWLGSVAAYMLVTVISVLIGLAVSKFIKPEIVRYVGACLFIILGILMLFDVL